MVVISDTYRPWVGITFMKKVMIDPSTNRVLKIKIGTPSSYNNQRDIFVQGLSSFQLLRLSHNR